MYVAPPQIPVAEALALEARRVGSDTHMTLMSDDLWFTSMDFLPRRWLEQPSPAEEAIARVMTANVYIGGLADAAQLQRIPRERLAANAAGGARTGKPDRKSTRL